MKYVTLLLLASLASAALAAEPAALKLTQTIPLPSVKGRFDHFAIDPAGKRLFVAALGNNTLEVIDLAAGKRIHSLARMSKPTGVLYLPDPNQVIVANGDDGTLKILSGADLKVLQNLAALAGADNLRFDPKTKLAWLGYGEGSLAIIDPAAAKLLGSVKLPAHPESFQLEKGDRRIFVNVPDAKQVAVIDRVKRTVTDTWPMETFQANFPMALDEANRRLFIGCRKPARLVVLDTANGKPVADLAISGDIDDLFYDAARKRLYLSCGEGFIDTVDQTTPDAYRRVSQVPTAPGARTCYFSPGPDRLYLAVPDRGSQEAEIRVFQPQK
jgi:DNA-binding beta-propeller fold protein YncE